MHLEEKTLLRQLALRYALACEVASESLVDMAEQVLQIEVVWHEVPHVLWERSGLAADQALLLVQGRRGTPRLIITTCSVRHCPEALFAFYHELSHWMMQHIKDHLIKYGAGGKRDELQASYCALALLCVMQPVFVNRLSFVVDDALLARLGNLFLRSQYPSPERALDEVLDIRRWQAAYYKNHA